MGRGKLSTPAGVVRAARERRRLVAGFVALAVLASLVFNFLREPVYRAEAVVSVEPVGELAGVRGAEDLPYEVLNTVAREDLLEDAAREAGWSAGVAEFKEHLYVEEFTDVAGQSGLRVHFRWTDAEETARAANAYAEVLVERAQQFGEERFAGGTLAADTSLKSEARTPPSGYWLRVLSGAGISVLAGVLAGAVAALLLESRGRGWSSVRDVESALKVPVIGVVPEYRLIEGEEKP